MENKVLFEGIIQRQDGTRLFGPVSTNDNDKFLFRNKLAGVDYWLLLQKNNGFWRKVDGVSGNIPVEHIIQLGDQIDTYFTDIQ